MVVENFQPTSRQEFSASIYMYDIVLRLEKMGQYLNYLKKLEYPEYAHQVDEQDKISLALLDLSFIDGQRINEEVYKIIREGQSAASRYAFSQNKQLLELTDEYVGVDQKNILITAGGDGALRVIASALIEKDTRVCIPLPSFGRFEYHAKVNQANIKFISPNGFPYDIDINQVAETCQKNKSEILFLANPNNPTGIYKASDKIEWLLGNFGGYVVLDEVLIDYIGETSAQLIRKYPKLVVVRSFSKLFGMSGMRIGYLIADQKLITSVKKLVSPFEVSTLAILLAVEMLKNRHEIIAKNRNDLIESLKLFWQLKSKLFQISPSQASTLVLKSSVQDDLYETLLQLGVRTVAADDFRGLEDENCVRVSIREFPITQKFVEILSGIEKSAPAGLL